MVNLVQMQMYFYEMNEHFINHDAQSEKSLFPLYYV